MKKCIILYTANYCQKISNYFCVGDLLAKGVNVEFWNVGPITINEKLSEVYSPGLIIKTIIDKKTFEKNVEINKNEVFFSFINYAWYSFYIYRVLSKFNCDIAYCTSGVLPSLYSEGFLHRLKKMNPIQLFYGLRNRIYMILKGMPIFKPSKYVLLSCNKASSDYKTSPTTVSIGVNSGDYQSFLFSRNKKVDGVGDKYVVYVDQYLPFHNDFILRGMKHIEASHFYAALNSFFKKIEERYNCEVVIAAHPSSVKYREYNFFDGRKIFYNKTASLISNSLGAIICNSTAISFPVLEYKPVIIYTTDEIQQKYISLHTELFPQILGLKYLNLDAEKDCSFGFVDKDKYDSYRYAYLTTPVSEKVNNSDIIISILNNNYKKYIYHE